jgi:hypothetical protein
MTNAQIEGLLRSLMLVLGAWAAKYGVDEATWLGISGGVVMIAGAAWSYYSNSTARMVEQVAKSNDVEKVVVEPAMANSIPSQKVVPHDPARDL